MPIDSKRLPSWSEFLFVADKQGIKIVEKDLKISGPSGPEPPVRYLLRKDGIKVIVPSLGLGEIVQEPVFSNLCRRLPLDPTPLGISPEELNPEDEA